MNARRNTLYVVACSAFSVGASDVGSVAQSPVKVGYGRRSRFSRDNGWARSQPADPRSGVVLRRDHGLDVPTLSDGAAMK